MTIGNKFIVVFSIFFVTTLGGAFFVFNALKTQQADKTAIDLAGRQRMLTQKYFKEYNHLDEIDNWNLVIDDAKHFLSNTNKKFDLMIVDIPAPYYIQTALLFTREFYSMVKDRLAPDGVISIYLCERFSQKRKKFISSRIIAAINTVFDDFCIVSSRRAGYSFLMASEQFDFVKSKKRIADIIDSNNLDDSCRVLDKEKIMEVVADTKPSSFSNLDIVLNLNLWALPYDIDCR